MRTACEPGLDLLRLVCGVVVHLEVTSGPSGIGEPAIDVVSRTGEFETMGAEDLAAGDGQLTTFNSKLQSCCL